MPPEEDLEYRVQMTDPVLLYFRKLSLEAQARKQNSDLYCPSCQTHLPYSHLTVADEYTLRLQADGRPETKLAYYCTLCERSFEHSKST